MADSDYIDVPFDDDPDALAEEAFEFLQIQYPDWLPNDGNLDTWMLEAMARIGSEIMRLAAQVPKEIFKFAGEDLFRVLPVEAQSAVASTTWTMNDSAGYTIDAGSLVGIRTSGNELVAFQTVVEIVIPPGQTVNSNVSIIAVEEGEAGSGLGDVGEGMELIDQLTFVSSITLNAPTSGGEDAESTDEYLDRLKEVLSLLTPRPVLAKDYAPVARSYIGGRSVAIDNWIPGTNEQQTIDITPDPTGGTFTLTWNAQTALGIPWNATAAQIQTALEGLSNIGVGDVRVTGGPLPAGTITVEFLGVLAEQNVAAMSGNGGGLSGAGGPFSIAVATPIPGVAPTSNADRAVTVAVADDDGEPWDSGTKVSLDTYLQSLREQNFIISIIDPNYTIIDVTFTVKKLEGFEAADIELRTEEAVYNFLHPRNWGKEDLPLGGRNAPSEAWQNEAVIRYLEVAAVINSVEGVDYITTSGGNFDLLTSIIGGTPARLDINLIGTVPLPRPGTIAATVT